MLKFALLTLCINICCFSVLAHTFEEKEAKLAQIKQLKTSGNFVFAILPKLAPEPFFDVVAKGCADAARKHNAHCIYYGSPEKSARIQTQDVTDLIEAGVDGLALSAIKNGLLKDHTREKIAYWQLPIVAFDSPLNEPVAKAYIGTDNYAMGYRLGIEVRKMRPTGGTYCVQFASEVSPNHKQRLNGIIDGLTNSQQDTSWSTVFGCPISFNGVKQRAIRQITRVLKTSKPDVLLSTGGGGIFSENAYKKAILPYKTKIASSELIIASIDTVPAQIRLLKEGLSTINIGQRPYEMGVKTFETLWALADKQKVDPIMYTGTTYCTQTNVDTCLD